MYYIASLVDRLKLLKNKKKSFNQTFDYQLITVLVLFGRTRNFSRYVLKEYFSL